MAHVWNVAVNQGRLVLKSRGTVIVMLALPVLFVFLFGLVFGNDGNGMFGSTSLGLAVADEDGSSLSHGLIAELAMSPDVQVRTIAAEDAPRLFHDKDITYLLTIPAGWGRQLVSSGAQPPPLQLAVAPGARDERLMEAHVSRAARRTATTQRLAGGVAVAAAGYKKVLGKIRSGRVELGYETVATGGETASAPLHLQLMSGFTMMFVMSLLFSRAGALLRERQDGTLRRLLTAPVSKMHLLGGYLLSFFIVGMVQFLLLAVLGRLLFGITWGPPLQSLVIMMAAVGAAAGLSLFLATMVRTADQQGVLSSIVLISTSMLGGVFWPLDIVGPAMRRVALFVPQSWVMDGLRKAATGAVWSELMLPAGVLVAFAAIFLVVGMTRLRYE